jgi:hypothetical protein
VDAGDAEGDRQCPAAGRRSRSSARARHEGRRFGATFWWAFGLLLVAFAAAFLLPRTKPEAPADEEDEPFLEDAAPVLIHA